jgi:hypothetical protein
LNDLLIADPTELEELKEYLNRSSIRILQAMMA